MCFFIKQHLEQFRFYPLHMFRDLKTIWNEKSIITDSFVVFSWYNAHNLNLIKSQTEHLNIDSPRIFLNNDLLMTLANKAWILCHT